MLRSRESDSSSDNRDNGRVGRKKRIPSASGGLGMTKCFWAYFEAVLVAAAAVLQIVQHEIEIGFRSDGDRAFGDGALGHRAGVGGDEENRDGDVAGATNRFH